MSQKKDPQRARIEAVIANGERLVQEAQQTLEAADRFFAAHGIDPRAALERVREQGGEEALEEVRRKITETLNQLEQDVKRRRMHGGDPSTARSRKPIRNAV